MSNALGNCTNLSEKQVQEAFIKAPPLLAQQILDLTVQHPNWLRDLPRYRPFPHGNGTIMEQLIFRGAMPQIERGFDKWKKLGNNTGCEDECESPDCGYNWTTFGGNGIERKITELMTRDFRSPSYCVREIQTTAHFKEVFAKIVENLYAQVDFFKEQSVSFNFLTSLAKKYVVDSGGAKANFADPYTYPALGTTTLSALNIEILSFFYEWMRKLPDAVPLDIQDGAPVFALILSPQLLSRLYRDDPQLRQDTRFSSDANALLSKYNFLSTIRGMYIPIPNLYPRRFNISSGTPVEVLPFVNGVPLEVGAYTSFNPNYEAATHEEVLIHGLYPFDIFYLPTVESLGENSSFGPDSSMFDSWQWVNPQTIQDPMRRVGFFTTNATIGLSQQYSGGLFGILVERPSVTLMASYYPAAECPPLPAACTNEIPAIGCPCPQIIAASPHPLTAGDYFIVLSTPTSAVADDVIMLGLSSGGFVNATVVEVTADNLTLQVTIVEAVNTCDFTSIFCVDTLVCQTNVDDWQVVCDDDTQLELVLNEPLAAYTATDTITLILGDGSQISADIVSADMSTNIWVVDVGASAFCNANDGVFAICVPTALIATCPGCDGVTFTACT